MVEKLRSSGIDVVGDVPWGTHFCQFYQTREDLTEVLVPYYKAGLENNEFCLWITSEPLSVGEAKEALREAFPDLDRCFQQGQIEIVPHTEWYLTGGGFNSRRVLGGWAGKLNEALARGYDGLRLTGNTLWLEKMDWRDFVAYEEEIAGVVGRYRMISLCTYSLDRCSATEVLDVIKNHQFSLTRRDGQWELTESLERKRTMEALRESEARYKSLFAHMINGFAYGKIICDGKGAPVDSIFIEVNSAFERLTGLRKSDVIGKRASEVMSGFENDPFDWIGAFGGVAMTGEPARFEQYAVPLGKWYSVAAYSPMSGHFVAVFEDISDRRRAAEKLRESQALLIALVEGTSDAVFAKDCYGRYLLFNSAISAITGRRSEEVIGKDDTLLFPPDEAEMIMEWDRMIMLSGETRTFEETVSTATGEKRVYLTTKGPLFDSKGEVKGLFGISRDITERKRTEEALRRAHDSLEAENLERRKSEEQIKEALRTKETLLRELYHRTKNNMNVISSLISLQTASLGDGEVLQMFRDLQHRIRSMSLVHQKLYQSRDLSNVNFRDYVADLASSLLGSYRADDGQVRLRLDIESFPLSIDAIIPCGLVMNELISNSLKYAFPNGDGEISIEGRMAQDGEIRIRYSDNGAGLPEGFDLKNTRSLGLKLVRRLMEGQLGGRVELGDNKEFLISFREPHYRKRI